MPSKKEVEQRRCKAAVIRLKNEREKTREQLTAATAETARLRGELDRLADALRLLLPWVDHSPECMDHIPGDECICPVPGLLNGAKQALAAISEPAAKETP